MTNLEKLMQDETNPLIIDAYHGDIRQQQYIIDNMYPKNKLNIRPRLLFLLIKKWSNEFLPEAFAALARLYFDGYGVKSNEILATKYALFAEHLDYTKWADAILYLLRAERNKKEAKLFLDVSYKYHDFLAFKIKYANFFNELDLENYDFNKMLNVYNELLDFASFGYEEAYNLAGMLLSIEDFAYFTNKYEEAFNHFEKAIELGHNESYFDLAQLYFKESYKRLDQNKGIELLIKGANYNDYRCMQQLCNIFLNSENLTDKDISLIYKYAKKGYKVHDDYLSVVYATCYLHGIHVDKNIDKAVEILNNFLEYNPNYDDALISLGHIYNSKFKEIDYPKNNKKAFKYYLKAAKADSALACYLVGLSYLEGHGCKKDKEMALKYFDKAKELGYNVESEIYEMLKTI